MNRIGQKELKYNRNRIGIHEDMTERERVEREKTGIKRAGIG